jgi:hypothetical protein
MFDVAKPRQLCPRNRVVRREPFRLLPRSSGRVDVPGVIQSVAEVEIGSSIVRAMPQRFSIGHDGLLVPSCLHEHDSAVMVGRRVLGAMDKQSSKHR